MSPPRFPQLSFSGGGVCPQMPVPTDVPSPTSPVNPDEAAEASWGGGEIGVAAFGASQGATLRGSKVAWMERPQKRNALGTHEKWPESDFPSTSLPSIGQTVLLG